MFPVLEAWQMKVRCCLHASVYNVVLSNHPSKYEALHNRRRHSSSCSSSSVIPQAHFSKPLTLLQMCQNLSVLWALWEMSLLMQTVQISHESYLWTSERTLQKAPIIRGFQPSQSHRCDANHHSCCMQPKHDKHSTGFSVPGQVITLRIYGNVVMTMD